VQIVRDRNDPKIRILANTSRLGYVRNFERAIAAARGQYVYFSDQDDIWLPHKVRASDLVLSRKGCVVSDAVVTDEFLHEVHASFFAQRQVHSFAFFEVLKRPCFIGATMACRVSYLSSLLPIPANVPHDFWITLNAILDHQLGVIRQPLIMYRRHSSTASVSATDRRRSLVTKLAERARILRALMHRRFSAPISSRR
jgi:hypothetical protein